jgi:hypothetical protein
MLVKNEIASCAKTEGTTQKLFLTSANINKNQSSLLPWFLKLNISKFKCVFKNCVYKCSHNLADPK